MTSIFDMSLKITDLRLQQQLQGANELNVGMFLRDIGTKELPQPKIMNNTFVISLDHNELTD